MMWDDVRWCEMGQSDFFGNTWVIWSCLLGWCEMMWDDVRWCEMGQSDFFGNTWVIWSCLLGWCEMMWGDVRWVNLIFLGRINYISCCKSGPFFVYHIDPIPSIFCRLGMFETFSRLNPMKNHHVGCLNPKFYPINIPIFLDGFLPSQSTMNIAGFSWFLPTKMGGSTWIWWPICCRLTGNTLHPWTTWARTPRREEVIPVRRYDFPMATPLHWSRKIHDTLW